MSFLTYGTPRATGSYNLHRTASAIITKGIPFVSKTIIDLVKMKRAGNILRFPFARLEIVCLKARQNILRISLFSML